MFLRIYFKLKCQSGMQAAWHCSEERNLEIKKEIINECLLLFFIKLQPTIIMNLFMITFSYVNENGFMAAIHAEREGNCLLVLFATLLSITLMLKWLCIASLHPIVKKYILTPLSLPQSKRIFSLHWKDGRVVASGESRSLQSKLVFLFDDTHSYNSQYALCTVR